MIQRSNYSNQGGKGDRPAHGTSGAPQPGKRGDFDLREYESKIPNWVTNNIDKSAVEFAESFGKHIADNDLTTSQIRIVFGEMKRIQMNQYVSEKTDFLLLKPKLAYAVKRHNKRGLASFYDFFKVAYAAVDTENDENGKKQFENMMQLMEAVLAYHKYHGGKE